MCGSRVEARKVARAVLTDRAAACVNILPGAESHYWWQGKLERAPEFLLVIKTTQAKSREVIRLVKAVHSYEVPEIIFLPVVSGEQKYMKWLRNAVAAVVVLLAANVFADPVDDLMGKLGAADDEARAEAADGLVRLGGARVEKKFREMLASKSPEQRQMAVAGLLQVSEADADVELVWSRLKDEDSTVRWTAVLALASAGRTEAVPWLEELAKTDGAESVREAATEAVAKLRASISWRREMVSGKFVLAYFFARNEPVCRQFEDGVLAKPVVVEAAREFVCVRLDAAREAKKYDVRGVPTVLVLDARGNELARVAGLVEAEQLVARLTAARRGGLTVREARRQAERDPADVAANWQVAEMYLDEGREDLAEPHLRNVLAYDIENRYGHTDRAMFALGFSLGRRKQYARAVYCLDELLKRWPEFKDKDKALYCLGLSRLALGQRDGARTVLKQLTREFPESGMAQAAKPVLDKLEAKGK
jgi:periplasmic divalent cation tolerance protein